MKRIAVFLMALLSSMNSSPGMAQIDYSTTYIQAPLWDSINRSSPIMTENFGSSAIFDEKAPVAAPQVLRFRPDAVRRKANIADYVAQVAKIDASYAPKLAAELADGSVFANYAKGLRSLGLDADSLGDNLAVWWIMAWEASKGGSVEAPPTAFAKVQLQVRRMLAGSSFSGYSDSQKQKFSDSLILQSVILGNQIAQAKASPVAARQLSNGIKQGAMKLGLDLGRMTLTEIGFVPTGG